MRKYFAQSSRIVVAAGMLGLLGCGDAKLPTLDEVKQAASDSVESVQERAETAVAGVRTGSIEIALDAPLKVAEGYARVARFSGNRPGTLQITSYADPVREKYPSVFLRADLPSGPATPLAGQTLQAIVYVQPVNGGPVWQSAAPVEVRIAEADEKIVSGEIVRGEMVNTETEVTVQLSGKFTAVLP